MITSNRKELVIMDTTLKELQVISLNESSTRCAISPNGQYLVTEGKDSKADFFIWKAGSYKASGSIDFPGGSTVLGMGFLGNNEFYMAGGPLNILQFYSVKENALTIADVNSGVTLSGAGRTFTGIVVHDKNLALNDDSKAQTNSSADFKYIFNTEAGRLQNFVVADSLLYPLDPIERDSIRISVDSSATQMYIYTLDSVTGTIRRDGGNGYQHVCATVTTKHQVISGSAAGFLNLYNNKGEMLAAFIGHEGDVKSIQETKDGNFLFSTSLDKTIRMWDLRQVKNQLSFRTYTDLENGWKQFISKYYPAFDSSAANPIEWLYNEMMKEGSEASAVNATYLILPQYIEPRLNLFIAENNEWVMWNNKGYFKASGNGAAYIGWYVYKGEDTDAEFYTADKLYDNYYRPDIINHLLFSNEYTADILRNSKDVSNLSIAEQVSNMPVLRLEKLVDTSQLTDKNINLKFSVDNKEFLGDVLLYQNGKRITINADMIRGLKVGAPGIPVELVTGENLFVASVLNKNKVESTPIKFKLTYIGARPSSNLYILAVGVDRYKNNRYNLNYAKADASGIVQQLAGSAKTIFKNIQVDSLFDEEATVENLTGKMELLQKKIKPEDVFLFFFAGHGIMNDPVDATKPDFYLVLHKVTQMTGNETMLKENALSATGLKDLLLNIPAQKQLVLLDACNSGVLLPH
ncbi:MAG: caspase family protein [Chitinophagaceae bacterium]|nr:caspase family protein [Chitinophagaceae bacterium]